jgi:hypothetical protein
MIKAPENRPAAPKPATARPRINITDDTAVAHIKLPNSKTARNVMYAHFREKF